MKAITEKQQAEIGQQWAEILMLKKSKDYPDRYDLTTGDKTALGVYRTIKRMVEEA